MNLHKYRLDKQTFSALAVTVMFGICAWPACCLAADPQTVMREVRAATGGDAWSAIHTLHTRSKVTTSGREGTSEHWEDVLTGRYLKTEDVPPKSVAEGYDGVTIWTRPSSGIAYVLGDQESAWSARNESFRTQRGWWPGDIAAATLGDEGVRSEGTQSFDVVRMTPEGGRAFTVWVNRTSHLIERITEQGAERLSVTRLGDYRWVGGVKLPFEIRRGEGDGASEDIESILQIETNIEIANERFALPALPASTDADPSEPVTVPFRLDDNRIFVDVQLNGKGPFEAEFDSGGSLVVPPDVLAGLGASARGQSRQTGGGEGFVLGGSGRVDTLSIGAARLQHVSCDSFVWDDEKPRRVLIGLEVLQQFIVSIDFDHSTMTLVRPGTQVTPPKGTVLQFQFQDNQPQITGAIDGIAATFAVDTGDDGSLLLIAPFASRYRFAERYRATQPYGGKAIGATRGLWTRVHDVVLNGADGRPGLTVTQPVTRISQQQSGFDAHRYLSANLGIGILKQFNITFDYPNRQLTLAPSHFYGQHEGFSRSGMQLTDKGQGWLIEAVYPDSPAGLAGLAAGDAILSIEGHTRPQLSRTALRNILTAPAGAHVKVRFKRGAVTRQADLTLFDLL